MEYLTLPDTDVNMRAEVRWRERGEAGPDDWTPLTPFPRFNAQNLATALHYASGSGGVDHAAIVKARGACEPPQNTC